MDAIVESARLRPVRSSIIKRSLEIETALHWTYRDELPKQIAALSYADHSPPGIADYGTAIDCWDRDPGMPAALGPPHPDAFTINAAVQELQAYAIDCVSGVQELAPECSTCIDPNDRVLRAFCLDPRPLVVTHARMGTRPQWDVAHFEVNRQLRNNGRIVVNEADETGHRYGHCPLDVVPDPRSVVIDRAEYVAWHQALTVLVDALANHLVSMTIRPPIASARPWLEPKVRAPKILADLTAPWFPRAPKRKRR